MSKPTDQAAGNPRSIVVWRAANVKKTELVAQYYCIARVGPAGSPWAAKPRSGGRRSGTSTWTVNPDWHLAFTVNTASIDNPEVQIRVFDKDWISEDDFIGEATARLSELPDTKAGKELALVGGGATGSVFVSSGPPEMLEKLGVKPSAFYEKLVPFGEEKTVMVDDITGDGPFVIGKAPLPKAMRGLFWLSAQGQSSAIASFGGPNNDGAGCSQGLLQPGGRYSIRVAGDRVWAFSENVGLYQLVQALDLVYHFTFDNADDPKQVTILPEAKNLGLTLTGTWLLDFEGDLIVEGDPKYPGSIVWRRPSYILGKQVNEYLLIQIMDEHGKRIEPAWTEFVKYQMSPESGPTPGKIFYHAIA